MTTPGGFFPPDTITGGDVAPLDGLSEASFMAQTQANNLGGYNAAHAANKEQKVILEAAQAAIKDLQDQQQILEGVIGYGQWFRETVAGNPAGATSRVEIPMAQSGPAVGCFYDGSRIVLTSKGLWMCKFRAVHSEQLDGKGPRVSAWLRCKLPNGTLVTESYYTNYPDVFGAFGEKSQAGTVNMWMDVVAPVAGCYIELWVFTSGARNFHGGINNNSWTVKKESNELGPGMRLSAPFDTTPEWQRLGPMQGTGGGQVNSNRVGVLAEVTNARVDAIITGSDLFDARIVSDGTVRQTSLAKSGHQMLYDGAVSPGQQWEVQVRSATGAQVYSQANASWLTIMNHGQSVVQ